MASKYTLKIVTDFAAAHALRGYRGECSQVHGHNWKVEVEVIATSLDEVGMGIDFKSIKSTAKTALARLDHRHLNDIAPFNDINPTAENIAAYLFRQLSSSLNGPRTQVGAVIVWETDRACVRYTEE